MLNLYVYIVGTGHTFEGMSIPYLCMYISYISLTLNTRLNPLLLTLDALY